MHLLVVLSLLSMFMFSASRIFMMIHRTIRLSGQATTMVHQTQFMFSYLRSDVWSATSMKPNDTNGVVLEFHDSPAIVWTFADQSLIRQVSDESQPVRTWPNPASELSFKVEGPTLVIRMIPTSRLAPTQVRMSSEVLLARAMQTKGDPP